MSDNEYVDPIVAEAERAAAESIAFAEELATPTGEPAEIHVADFGAAIAEAEEAAARESVDEETRSATNPDPNSTDGAPPAADEGDGDNYEELSKPELADELGERGLAKSGSKAELIERLRENDAEKA